MLRVAIHSQAGQMKQIVQVDLPIHFGIVASGCLCIVLDGRLHEPPELREVTMQ